MKNDLTTFEKNLLRSINFSNATKYTHKNFMEWSSNEKAVRDNLLKDEIVYEALGVFVAIKPTQIDKLIKINKK